MNTDSANEPLEILSKEHKIEEALVRISINIKNNNN